MQQTGQQRVPGVQHERGWRREGSKEVRDVLVPRIVKCFVIGSGLACEDAGEHELRGVPDRLRLHRVIP